MTVNVTYEVGISIHAPRVRCDSVIDDILPAHDLISIHAPRVRCDTVTILNVFDLLISIHAPRVRCDVGGFVGSGVQALFQSTHLV